MLSLFSLRASAAEIMNDERLTKRIYIEEYEDEVEQKLKKIAANETFKANPVQYVYEWRKKHEKTKLLNYQEFFAYTGFDTYLDESNKSAKICAIIRLARVLMSQPDYADSFRDWAKVNVKQLIIECYPETADEQFLETISRCVLEMINQEDFLANLKDLQPVVTRQKNFCHQTEEARKNKLSYFLYDYLGDLSDTKDLKHRQQENLVHQFFIKFFDLTYSS